MSQSQKCPMIKDDNMTITYAKLHMSRGRVPSWLLYVVLTLNSHILHDNRLNDIFAFFTSFETRLERSSRLVTPRFRLSDLWWWNQHQTTLAAEHRAGDINAPCGRNHQTPRKGTCVSPAAVRPFSGPPAGSQARPEFPDLAWSQDECAAVGRRAPGNPGAPSIWP